MEVILNGVLMGGIYSLTALGLTLIFGVMKVINFAHGTYLMVVMYVAYFLIELTGIDPYLSLLIGLPIAYAIGYFTQKVLINPILKVEKDVREPISILLLTAGLWIFFNNFFMMLFGPNYRSAETVYSNKAFKINELMISKPLIFAFLATLITTYLLNWMLRKTKLGKAIRATGQDRETAILMGIDIYEVYNIAFGIGIAVLGVAGTVLIPLFYVHPFVGDIFDMRAFVIVVLGGLGSIPGALLGGLLVGVIESISGYYLNMSWAPAVIYMIFLLVLFIKPSGMFGFEKEG